MQRYIGLDVHTTSTTMSVVSERGKELKSLVLETNGEARVEAIRLVPGRRQLCSRAPSSCSARKIAWSPPRPASARAPEPAGAHPPTSAGSRAPMWLP